MGLRLAHKLGRQQLYPVDGHSSNDMILKILPQLKKGLTPSLQDSINNSPHFKKSSELLQQGIKSGSLMPLYRYINSPEYLNADVDKQWRLFLNTPMPEKAGRARLAFWEMRNLTMAANIQRASGQHPTEPVLFIVGGSHKAFLDAYLDQMMGVKIVQLDGLLKQ